MKYISTTKKIIFTILLSVCFLGGVTPGTAQNLTDSDSKPEKLTDGHQFTEGPYWHSDGYLLFSDIPANTVYRWEPGMEEAKVYIKPSGHSNGIAADRKGNLILAQHDGMISRVGPDNSLKPMVQNYEGKRLNSPNDLTVSSDGSIYFTDPPFGVSDDERELEVNGVYRLTPNGRLNLLYDKLSRPNGLVFSPDEKVLYVNDSSSGRILAFDVMEDGNVSTPRELASVGKAGNTGAADGMEVDDEGNVYSTGPGGIHIFSPDGTFLKKLELPERATNIGWGGKDLNTLFITAPSGVYSLKMNATGRNK